MSPSSQEKWYMLELISRNNKTSMLIRLVLFFFSSRRRHTRCGRDWSSDVCSSDLTDFQVPFFTFSKLSSNFFTTNEKNARKKYFRLSPIFHCQGHTHMAQC